MAKSWKEVRAARRDKKAVIRNEKKSQLIEDASKLSEEEQQVFWENCRRTKHETVELHKMEREKLLTRLTDPSNTKLVIDCQFASLMTESELKSCCSQILFCYSAVKKMQNPYKLVLTSCDSDNPIFKRLKAVQFKDNFAQISQIIDFTPAHLPDLDFIDKAIYLTADAHDTVEQIDDDTIFIVGALVDKNRLPGITNDFAAKYAIRTAKLPLDVENLKSRTVITTNQVVEIITKAKDTRDLTEAINSVLPPRKIKS